MEKTLILRCSDGRNTPGLMLGFPDFKALGILEVPQIAASIPQDVVNIALTNDVKRVLVINHTSFPFLEGCGGLEAYAKLNGKPKSKLENWLKLHLNDSSPYVQAIETGQKLSFRLHQEVEIVVLLFDHNIQKLYPIGYKAPRRDWKIVDFLRWYESIAGNFNNIPSIELTKLSAWTQRLVKMNWANSTQARDIATQNQFSKGQQFQNLILNNTPYIPESIWLDFQAFEADPYFSVYTSSLFPLEAIAQMEYALSYLTKPTELWVLSMNVDQIKRIDLLLKDSPVFTKKQKLVKIRGILVTQKPY